MTPRPLLTLLGVTALLAVTGCGGSSGSSTTAASSQVMPNLKGMTDAQAISKLHGLTAGWSEVSQIAAAPAGTVIAQSVPPGAPVPAGTPPQITVSSGPKHKVPFPHQVPKPAPAPKPKPAPPPSPPPAPHASRYERALSALDQQCTENRSDLIQFATNSQAILLRAGIVESEQSIMIHVNQATPSAYNGRCDGVFAAYVILRKG